MLLKNLINNLPKSKKKIIITGLSIDSKKIRRGYIFFAINGNKSNGENFIQEAINKGASVIVCSNHCNYKNKKTLIIKKKILEIL